MRAAPCILALCATSSIARAQPAPPVATTTPADQPQSYLLTGALEIALPLAMVPMPFIIDHAEFVATGAAKTAWHVVGYTALATFVVAPTIGSLYAGVAWNTGAKIRLIGALVAIGGAALVARPGSRSEGGPTPIDFAGLGLLAAGGVTYGVGWTIESTIALRAVYHHNHRAATQLTIAPIAGTHDVVPGLAVVGTF